MSSLYAFRCWTKSHPLPTSSLVVFCGPNAFSYQDLITSITDATRRALSPEAVYLVFPENAVLRAEAALRDDDSAFAPLSADTIVGLYSYNERGGISFVSSVRGVAPPSLDLDDIRRQGLTELFQKNAGLLEAGPTAHFVKPSKRTDTRFLRASHALSEGAEIFFTAFWLLSIIDDDIDFVHLDTSSIASVVMAALLMKGGRRIPTIRTFHSYEGIEKHPFNIDRADLVLISASQSGSMADLLSTKVKDASRVVTLFTTSDAPNNENRILCDLRYDEYRNASGYKPSLPRPVIGTRPIRLIGEHFVAETEPPRAIVPAKPHAPDVVKDIISKLQGRGVFSAYRGGAFGDGRRAVWIDVERLRETPVFLKWVQDIVARDIPATTRAIVYSDRDPSSDLLARVIREEIEAHGGSLSDVVLLKLSDIEDGACAWARPNSPVVVAGCAAGHGAELLSMSRALRRYAPQSHRIFLSLATMPSSNRAFSLLRSNLVQPNHVFLSMFEIVVDRQRASQSWDAETLYLSDREDELPPVLSDRLDVLGRSSVGLSANLFLDGMTGPLTLRDNFAFWPEGMDCSKASQADVFVSMAVILENLRTGEKIKIDDKLLNDVQNHTVISGEAFARYNDGIIQAAILRSCLPIEINYEDASEQSRLVSDLILQMIDLMHRPQGEALGEFLMAMATGRLRLIKNDRDKILNRLNAKLQLMNETYEWLSRRLIAGDGV